MEIDVKQGDTFTIMESGWAYQYRDARCRALGPGGAWACGDIGKSELPITLSDFRRIAELAGHTIREVIPEQEAVVVTHMVEHKDFPHGACYFGTKAACENWANKNDVYVIRPVRFEVKQ